MTSAAPGGSVLSVVVIEDVKDVREGLAELINGTPGFRCPAVYRTMEEALPAIASTRPHVVLTDIGLPGMSGIEGIPLLRDRLPQVPIVVLTVYDNDGEVFRALCAGASGYLLKNMPTRRLLDAVKDVAGGGAPMSPEVARRVMRLFRDFGQPPQERYRLTPQESELLKLLVDGHHKKTAAAALGISVHTVSFHLKNIYEKLQVHSKTEAVAKALRERII